MHVLRLNLATLASLTLVTASMAARAEPPTMVVLPGGAEGVGFDDLAFSSSLDRVLIPGGALRKVFLVDPKTGRIDKTAVLPSPTRADSKRGGHGDGVTSAVVGAGVLVAIDRTNQALDVFDPDTGMLKSTQRLVGGPDYVRIVGQSREVWVTEPHAKQIEIFAVAADGALTHKAVVAVPDGPESLVIDELRGRAYTHAWKSSTYAIDLATHAVLHTWPNGCEGSRGIALDDATGLLFVGCQEGTITALDVRVDGKPGNITAKLVTGMKDVDIIAFNATLGHLYVPGGESHAMAIVGVGKDGALSMLATVPTADDASCVVADAHGQAWVCDPKGGRLRVLKDSAPTSR